MADLLPLEKNLNELYKKSPELPEGGKKALVEWAPWLALAGGILTLWSAWGLWHWAHLANSLIDYANSFAATYGGTQIPTNRLTLGIWLGIGVLVVEGVLYLWAFPGLRDRKKAGWNLLYWGSLINVAYGLVIMFTSYGTFGSFVFSLIGTAIGLYFLFQVRSRYSAAKASAHNASK